MKRKLIIAGVISAVSLALAGAVYASLVPGFQKAPAAAAAPSAVPVVAGIVASHDVPIYLRGVGTVIAYNTTILRSQIQGQLTDIAFTEGETAKAGDPLAQIDPRPYQAQLKQMKANRDRDQRNLPTPSPISPAIRIC
jgi:multidrug efflux system membrane fusion protein